MRNSRHIMIAMAIFLGIFLLSTIFTGYIKKSPTIDTTDTQNRQSEITKPNSTKQNTTPESIVIDYTAPTRKLDPGAIGMDISGYGYPYVFANDQNEQQKIKTLGIKYMRMDLKYSTPKDPTSMIICGGKGCDTRWTGDQWVQAIQAVGGQPVIIVPYSPIDAANLVRHFNKDTHNYIRYWIIGNEPDLEGLPVATYSSYFNQGYDAMKAIDPTIKIGGGTTAWYDSPFLQTFLQLSGSRVDFVDFHAYAQQGDVPGDSTTLFHFAEDYGKNINHLRSLIQQIVPARASQIGIEIGEWELNWGGVAQSNTNFHAVWAASVLGHILSSGGWSLFYADKANALYAHEDRITDTHGRTVNVNVNDTNPAYHGIGMFTGEQLFRRFGDTIVQTNTTLPNVEIYASDNPRNIVVINKDPSRAQTASVILHGATGQGLAAAPTGTVMGATGQGLAAAPTGTVDVWRKDESVLFPNPPLQLGTLALLNGTFTYEFPPFSVTTFVLNVS